MEGIQQEAGDVKGDKLKVQGRPEREREKKKEERQVM